MNKKVILIGAGNLATHLAVELQNAGCEIIQVFSRTENSAKELAVKLNTNFTTSPSEILSNADIYFVALKDAVVDEVLSQISFNNQLLVHCSGSLPLSVLKGYSNNTGVFYPLQTFSKKRKVDFSKIPLFIESDSKENERILLELARKISGKVSVLNSEKRKSLHIAAVFACNFTNHMYALAAEYLQTKDIDFGVLRPLIQETAEKIQSMHPISAQTGPAIRFDKNIIENHLNDLKELPNYQELYNSISKSIFEIHKEKEK